MSGKIVRKTVKLKTPPKGIPLYRVVLGDWVVCGKKTLMVLGSGLDGYVHCSDGLYWHPSGMRRARFDEMLRARHVQRAKLQKEWLEAAQDEAKRRGLKKVSRVRLLEEMQAGNVPVVAVCGLLGRQEAKELKV